MHHIFGIAAILVVLFVAAKGFFGSFWRAPPKREDSAATDWSSYGVNGSSDPGGHHHS